MKFLDKITKQEPEDPREKEAIKVFEEGMANLLDVIAPAAFIVKPNYLQLSDYFVKTFFVYT